MRTFYPNRLFLRIRSLVDDYFARSLHNLASLYIKLVNPDGAVSVVFGRVRRSVVIHNVRLSVNVEEERRVYAAHFWKRNRAAPMITLGICGLYIEVSAHIYGCIDNVERIVLLVVLNVWGIYAA